MSVERGKYFVFEGGEAVGKTTQIRSLSEYFHSIGFETCFVLEPGDTYSGDKIRSMVLEDRDLHPKTQALLFFAARNQLMQEKIIPALEQGRVVISDRSYLSTIVYQGIQGVTEEDLDILRAFVNPPVPDVVVLIDLPAEETAVRVQKSGKNTVFDLQKLDFHQKVRERYQALALQDPDRWIVIDGTQTPQEIQEQILTALSERGILERLNYAYGD